MPRIEMHVLSDEDIPTHDLATLAPKHNAPVYKGAGETDYVCGNCGAVLLESIEPTKWREILIRCRCGATNDAHP